MHSSSNYRSLNFHSAPILCCTGIASPATIIQGGGKHGGLGGGGKHGGGAFNIIVGVPTPVPTPVPVPVYQPVETVAHVQHIPRTVKGQQAIQVPVTTKQQFQGTSQ